MIQDEFVGIIIIFIFLKISNDLSIQTERQCEVHSAQNRPSHLSDQVVQQEVGTEQLTVVVVVAVVVAVAAVVVAVAAWCG